MVSKYPEVKHGPLKMAAFLLLLAFYVVGVGVSLPGCTQRATSQTLKQYERHNRQQRQRAQRRRVFWPQDQPAR